MKKTGKKIKRGIVAWLLALSFTFAFTIASYADDVSGSDPEETVEEAVKEVTPELKVELTSVAQGDLEGDGKRVLITAQVTYGGEALPEGVAGKYAVHAYVGTANKNVKVTADGSISFNPFTVNSGKTYDVYAVLKNGGEVVAESSHKTISVVQTVLDKKDITVQSTYDDEETGTITVNVDESVPIAYYKHGVGKVGYAENGVISGLSQGKYYVYIPAYSDGDTYYVASKKQETNVGSVERPKYTITVNNDENIKWSKNEATVLQGAGTSFNVNPKNDDYYISNVYALPKENAEISWYEPTGGVTVSNVSGDVTLYAEATKKNAPAKIEVTEVSFNPNGIYSEENPYISTQISVKVTDKDGNPVPETTVYFKTDKNEKSPSSKTTDKDGIAIFKHSYGIVTETGDTTAKYEPLFSIDKSFEKLATGTTVNLVLQQKKDLVLYEDQITGSRPGKYEGEVSGVPEGYEIWTGEVHDAVIVLKSGTWKAAEDGKFTNLSSGWQLLRAGEKIDPETNTFWFASDHVPFVVPRLERAPVKDEAVTEEPTDKTVDEKDTKPVSEEKTKENKDTSIESSDPVTQSSPAGNEGGSTNNESSEANNEGGNENNETPAPAPAANASTAVIATVRNTVARTVANEAATDAEPIKAEEIIEDTAGESIATGEVSEPVTAGSKTEVEIKDEGVAKAAVASEVKDKNILLNVSLLLALPAVLAAATYAYYRYKKKAAQND